MKKICKLVFIFLVFFSVTICEAQENQRVYERFISLGNCCAPRVQINHHLPKRFGKNINAFGGGQLFDWLVIRDYHKLALAIENNLQDLFERSDLELTPPPGFRSVINVKYAMSWVHLFSRNPDESIAENIIDLEYATCKQKIDYLSKKFKSLSQYPTLYILTYPFERDGYINTKEPDRAALIHLRNALEKFRGNRNFDILYCPLIKKFEDFENIYVRKIINPTDRPPFKGDSACWDWMLSQFPFSLEKNDERGRIL
jgi:hypothetical protein